MRSSLMPTRDSHDRTARARQWKVSHSSKVRGSPGLARIVKDRAAHALIDAAVASGELKPGGTLIQGTGGNTGISLAMIAAAAAEGYKCHLTIPENISPDKIELMKLLGAELTVLPLRPIQGPAVVHEPGGGHPQGDAQLGQAVPV